MSKLAELRATATYSQMSLEAMNEMRKAGNAKRVFECLNFDYNDRCYSLTADSILKAVKIYGQGFLCRVSCLGGKTGTNLIKSTNVKKEKIGRIYV